MNTIKIDTKKCVSCGMCIKDCLTECIEFNEDNIPEMKHEERCLKCQHCLAVCPTGALSFNDKLPENSEKVNFKDILSIIKSRKSIRQYKDEEIPEEIFEKIKEMLPYIPTGCNSHALHFSFVEKKDVMDYIREKTIKALLKAISYKIMSPIAKKFSYYKEALEKGDDVVYRGAPHMVVVSSPVTAPCAPIDPIIALSYFELYVQSLGLGTCWCGYAEMCIKLMPQLCDVLEIPAGYTPVYAMLLGIPDVKYHRTTQPEKYQISEIRRVNTRYSCLWCKAKRLFTNFLRG